MNELKVRTPDVLAFTVSPKRVINPIETPAVVPTQRWLKVHDNDIQKIKKNYIFAAKHTQLRNNFIVALLNRELRSGHHASILTLFNKDDDCFIVQVILWTSGVNIVTEIDKEYARFADIIYQDILTVGNI